MAKILRLGIKNEWILFVLLSTFRNFETFVSKTGGTSEIKMKTVFLFSFLTIPQPFRLANRIVAGLSF